MVFEEKQNDAVPNVKRAKGNLLEQKDGKCTKL